MVLREFGRTVERDFTIEPAGGFSVRSDLGEYAP